MILNLGENGQKEIDKKKHMTLRSCERKNAWFITIRKCLIYNTIINLNLKCLKNVLYIYTAKQAKWWLSFVLLRILSQCIWQNNHIWSHTHNLFSSSGPDNSQVMNRSCPGHLKLSSISELMVWTWSWLYDCNATTHQQTFLSEITQISLQEVKHKHKGRFRETSEDAHRHGQAKIT